MWDLFFAGQPANSQLPELADMHTTWTDGGYYRVQISDNVHVLSVNTLPYNAEDRTDDADLKINQLNWLSDQLAQSAPTDKFILISHIYETSQAGWANWTEDTNQRDFYELMLQYRDQIIFEITGHDHLADLRAHSATEIYDKTNNCMYN